MVVRHTMRFKTLVIQAKNLLKNQFDTIELHAVDDMSYVTISLVAQCLMKYKYVTMARLKTKTHQVVKKKDVVTNARGQEAKYSKVYQNAEEDADSRIVLQPKLVIHLKKTPEFDQIYDEFEALYQKMAEEHAEEIAMGDKEAASAEEAERADVDSGEEIEANE